MAFLLSPGMIQGNAYMWKYPLLVSPGRLPRPSPGTMTGDKRERAAPDRHSVGPAPQPSTPVMNFPLNHNDDSYGPAKQGESPQILTTGGRIRRVGGAARAGGSQTRWRHRRLSPPGHYTYSPFWEPQPVRRWYERIRRGRVPYFASKATITALSLTMTCFSWGLPPGKVHFSRIGPS